MRRAVLSLPLEIGRVLWHLSAKMQTRLAVFVRAVYRCALFEKFDNTVTSFVRTSMNHVVLFLVRETVAHVEC